MHLGLFCIRHWLVVYSHPSAFRFRVLMPLGLCYSRHELLVYTHPSAFGVRLLMHVWRLRAAQILTPQCVRIAIAPYCSGMCGRYMPLGEKPLGQDCGSHAPRTLQDCGFSCPWSSSKDNVPRASKQTSHFRAAPKMLGVVLYQSRASGVHPPQCIRICNELLAHTHPSAFGLRFPMHVKQLHAAGTRTHAHRNPTAFALRLLLHAWRLHAARTQASGLQLLHSLPPDLQDYDFHALRTPQDCGSSSQSLRHFSTTCLAFQVPQGSCSTDH